MKLTNAVLYAVLAAEAPNPKTDALAAKGPAAIAEALEAELAKAEKVGDTEHAESIKRHWADYLSERKERINDAKGGVIQTRQRRAINQGPAAVVEALTKTPNAELEEAEKFGDKEHINSIEKHLADYASERRERIADAEGGHLDTRQAAAAGPDDRKARAGNVAAVEAALEQEFKEAEKYNDKEHEASLQKHLMDYLHMEHGLGRNRQNIADREGPRAEYEALLGQLHEAEKFHDVEHEASIEKHWRDYLGRVEGTTPAWDYSDDEAKAALEKAAFYHRHHVTRENAYPEARREHNDMRNQRAATCHMPLSTANDLKHEAGCRSGFSYGQWSLVYNACSFGIASMASAMLFVWLMLLGNQVHKKFKPALGINGLVTGIAAYHYFRIFNSWCDSFDVFYDGESPGGGRVRLVVFGEGGRGARGGLAHFGSVEGVAEVQVGRLRHSSMAGMVVSLAPGRGRVLCRAPRTAEVGPLRGELDRAAVQRCVPVRRLAPDRAAPSHRADPRDAAAGGGVVAQDVDARRGERVHGRVRVPGRGARRPGGPLVLLGGVDVPVHVRALRAVLRPR
jgi:hypothetical protein